MRSRPHLKLGHVESKTRTLGQVLDKPCKDSRGPSYEPIFMKILAELVSVCNVGHI